MKPQESIDCSGEYNAILIVNTVTAKPGDDAGVFLFSFIYELSQHNTEMQTAWMTKRRERSAGGRDGTFGSADCGQR